MAIKKRVVNLCEVCADVAILVMVVGFWFHTSRTDVVFGKYNPVYFYAIVCVTVVGLCGTLFVRFLFTRYSLGMKLLVTTLLAVILFFPLEVILTIRDQRIRNAKLQSYHPFLQIVPVPGNEHLKINRWGFRGEDIELKKPAGTYRIFVLGGSTVFCSEVNFEDTHCRVMENRLREAYPHVSIEVQNAGMDWHTSQHSLMKFLFKVQNFKPDMILVFHAVNDLTRSFSPPDLARPEYAIDYSNYEGPVAGMRLAYASGNPALRSVLFDKVAAFWSRCWFSDWRHPEVPIVAVSHWKSLDEFERNLSDLASIVLAKKIDLVMASQPYFYKEEMTDEELHTIIFPDYTCFNASEKPDLASMIRGMDLFNRTSRQIADDHGVLFVDLESLVPKTLDYFKDDVHYTERGNELVGDALAEKVILHKAIEKKFPK